MLSKYVKLARIVRNRRVINTSLGVLSLFSVASMDLPPIYSSQRVYADDGSNKTPPVSQPPRDPVIDDTPIEWYEKVRYGEFKPIDPLPTYKN